MHFKDYHNEIVEVPKCYLLIPLLFDMVIYIVMNKYWWMVYYSGVGEVSCIIGIVWCIQTLVDCHKLWVEYVDSISWIVIDELYMNLIIHFPLNMLNNKLVCAKNAPNSALNMISNFEVFQNWHTHLIFQFGSYFSSSKHLPNSFSQIWSKFLYALFDQVWSKLFALNAID